MRYLNRRFTVPVGSAHVSQADWDRIFQKGPTMEWNKEHPDWEAGCRDRHMADLETAATKRVLEQLKRRRPNWEPTVLDVGAGSGKVSRELFPRATRIDLVPDPCAGVLYGDVRKLPDGDGLFDLVHVRRVLSNLEAPERGKALCELMRVLAVGGHLLLVDVFKNQHDRVNALRRESGLADLPPQHMGKGFLERPHCPPGLNPTLVADIPIGGSYYLWTRWWLPAFETRMETPWDLPLLREAHPQWPKEAEDRFAVHRLLVLRKD